MIMKKEKKEVKKLKKQKELAKIELAEKKETEEEENLKSILNDEDIDEEFTDVKSKHSFKFLKKLVVILILLIIFSRFYGVSQIITKEYSIIDNNIPRGFDGMKIVQISDIHYGTTVNEAKLKRIVNKVNELKPDIVAFTGDLVDKSINTTDKIKAEITVNLSKLEASIGKYAIASTEDLNNSDFNYLMTNSGFEVLDNTSKLLYNDDVEPILLVGISDFSKKLELTDNYKIALIHCPDNFDKIKDDNYNLVLAGHSHGGIIRFPIIGGLINIEGAQKYHNDFYEINDTKLYVSSGLGTSNINFRMFNQPAINLYRFYKD